MSVNNPSFMKTNLAQGSANDGLLLALYCPSAKYGYNIFFFFLVITFLSGLKKAKEE